MKFTKKLLIIGLASIFSISACTKNEDTKSVNGGQKNQNTQLTINTIVLPQYLDYSDKKKMELFHLQIDNLLNEEQKNYLSRYMQLREHLQSTTGTYGSYNEKTVGEAIERMKQFDKDAVTMYLEESNLKENAVILKGNEPSQEKLTSQPVMPNKVEQESPPVLNNPNNSVSSNEMPSNGHFSTNEENNGGLSPSLVQLAREHAIAKAEAEAQIANNSQGSSLAIRKTVVEPTPTNEDNKAVANSNPKEIKQVTKRDKSEEENNNDYEERKGFLSRLFSRDKE